MEFVSSMGDIDRSLTVSGGDGVRGSREPGAEGAEGIFFPPNVAVT